MAIMTINPYARIESIDTVSHSLFTCSKLSAKFQIHMKTNGKLGYSSNYSEYLGENNKLSITESNSGSVIISIHGTGVYFVMNESSKERFAKKLKKLVSVLDAYDCEEVDIISVDQTGTHIRTEIAGAIIVHLQGSSISFRPIVIEEVCKVGVVISNADGELCVLNLREFISFYYAISNANFTEIIILLSCFANTLPLGYNRNDNRTKTNQVATSFSDDNIPKSLPSNTISGREDLETPSEYKYNKKKVKW